MAKIGIIGIGNMGIRNCQGLLKQYGKEGYCFYTDVNQDRCAQVSKELALTG